MAPCATKRKRTVFLVDDHPLVREWLTNLISQQPDLAVCGEAESVPQTAEKIMSLEPDAVVVDISLKGPSGLELIKELKQRSPGLALLVLSMHEGPHYVERALQAGANGYVTKRESARKVIEAIRRILEGGFYVSADTGQILAERLVAGKAPAELPSVEQLSEREREVFELLADGKNVNQIALELRIDVKTVHTYCARMREKLQLNSTADLLREAFRWQEEQRSS
jgi:DNA-binding NarL/FixJ family response regulator